MPFGLCNAPGTFQSYINKSVMEFLDVCCTAYLDDILIYSEDPSKHESQVLAILKRLLDRGLYVDINKCEFGVNDVKYLGLVVSIDSIKIDPEKVKAVQEWEMPKSTKDVLAFLGFANFYCRFIHNFS
jgi:patatin-like phospholipase/acyl hydrolase